MNHKKWERRLSLLMVVTGMAWWVVTFAYCLMYAIDRINSLILEP